MLRPGQLIIAAAFALLTIGVVMVNSAGMTIDAKNPITAQSILLSRSTIYMALAVLAMGLAARFAPVAVLGAQAGRGCQGDGGEAGAGAGVTSGWRFGPLWIGVLVTLVALAVVYIPGIGTAKKGAQRWVEFKLPAVGELSIQPSELAKWGMIFVVAFYASRMGPRLASFTRGLVPGLVALGAVAGFMVIEDLGTAVLIVLVGALLLVAGGARLWQLLLLLPVGALALGAAIWQHPYRLERIAAFLNPYSDAEKSGFHMIQSMVAVANGEVWGRGLGNGLQKFGYLPEDTTDFVFAIICEELGLFGAGLVVALYGIIVYAGWRIVRHAPSAMLKLVALGIVATLGLQAIINLGVVTAVFPTKGIALPLLSSGGTGWILTAASLGVLAAIDRLIAPDAEHLEAAAGSGGVLLAVPSRGGAVPVGTGGEA